MVFSAIRDILAKNLNVDSSLITMQSSFEDLQIDSLYLIELVYSVEELYGIKVEQGAVFNTVSDLVEYVEKNIK